MPFLSRISAFTFNKESFWAAGGFMFIKNLLLLINFLSMLAGLMLVGVGTYMQTRDDPEDIVSLSGSVAISAIIIGIIVSIISFLGCFGAANEKGMLLKTYFALLILVILFQIGVGSAAYAKKDELPGLLEKSWESASNRTRFGVEMAVSIPVILVSVSPYEQYPHCPVGTEPERLNPKHLLSSRQQFRCCGFLNITDRPENAPECAYNIPCAEKIERTLTSSLNTIGGAGIAMGVIELCGLIFSVILFRRIAKRNNQGESLLNEAWRINRSKIQYGPRDDQNALAGLLPSAIAAVLFRTSVTHQTETMLTAEETETTCERDFVRQYEVADVVKAIPKRSLISVEENTPVDEVGGGAGSAPFISVANVLLSYDVFDSTASEEFQGLEIKETPEFLKHPISRVVGLTPESQKLHSIRESDPLTNPIKFLGQIDLVEFLFKHARIPDKVATMPISDVMNRTMERRPLRPMQAAFLPESHIIAVNVSEPALLAIKRMRAHGVPSVAVVDDYGALVTTLSASDIRSLRAENLHEVLKPVNAFLQSTLGQLPEPHICPSTWPLSDCIEKILRYRMHRLFVIDNDTRPIGVVSLSDIISVFEHGMEDVVDVIDVF
ncbi:hypothetical protein HK102_008606 [Quaeritorhiza haematococci]|nr:hypothetical protein HK102_008606 [Quaeritorhiza haematococci]